MQPEKIRIDYFSRMKREGKKITALTAYDKPFASIIDNAGIEMVIVGDSLGMVSYGYENTLRVSMEQMIYHLKAVKRGIKRAFIVADMPFLSYQLSIEEAKRNAGRLLQAGAEAVKLEGGETIQETISSLVSMGIPVMGHVGLTPQSVNQLGGYRVQGRSSPDSAKVCAAARAVQAAGAFSLVLEGIPAALGKKIARQLKIPAIGIGAGAGCDGQVLVIHDLLGLSLSRAKDNRSSPKFVKEYARLGEETLQVVQKYIKEVKGEKFPGAEHCY